MTSLILLLTLAVGAIAGTVSAVHRDGYRRAPDRRPLREYERDEPYAAWSDRA
ncbi:hypothetical protein [Microcella sp.]|uniref:hypothetical protein n=1 Tax=Microcella sp. TaxID=1913979 RepID=UPI002568D61A|nr:hypothetical protein [Microcella sp.]MBX9471797.1 hypothetical protein [Microcella sp.]